ncbi:MAG: peptide deformylase [Legionellales bacterium]|nr:MAG: peptide deformylase [Legionellales bacterium]
MTKLNVLKFPDPRLRAKAKAVIQIDAAITQAIADMLETMYSANGVGLAAIQVNIPHDIIVMDVSENADAPKCFINAKIIAHEDTIDSDEGCLSFPGIRTKVKRHRKVTVEYMDDNGAIQEITAADNLLSICLQHEIDHQNGITFYDHLSPLKQQMLRSKIKKLQIKGEY